MGLMLVIFSPEEDLTNSLLMKRPIGCLYSRPLGALSSMTRSDMSKVDQMQRGRAVRKETQDEIFENRVRGGRSGIAPQRGLHGDR